MYFCTRNVSLLQLATEDSRKPVKLFKAAQFQHVLSIALEDASCFQVAIKLVGAYTAGGVVAVGEVYVVVFNRRALARVRGRAWPMVAGWLLSDLSGFWMHARVVAAKPPARIALQAR